LEGLPVDRFAEALGLPGTPKIKFLSRELAKQKKNASREVQAVQEASSEEEDEDEPEESESEAEESNDDEEDAKADPKATNVCLGVTDYYYTSTTTLTLPSHRL
jgi:ATP-dependent RNA helicase DDX10/DBP4